MDSKYKKYKDQKKFHVLQHLLDVIYDGGREGIETTVDAALAITHNFEDMNVVCDIFHEFSMKSVRCAITGAKLFAGVHDVGIGHTTIKTLLIGKLLHDYQEINTTFIDNKKQLVVNAAFLLEVFRRIRLPDGNCCKPLVKPAIDYLIMLMWGDEESKSMIPLQLKHLQKDLQTHDKEHFENFVLELRRRILSPSSSSSSRALLLRAFDCILQDKSVKSGN